MTIYKNHKSQRGGYLALAGKIAAIVLLVISMAGCAHIMSKETLSKIDNGIRFKDLQNDTDRYKGKFVLLGGVIISAENKKEGTLLNIFQTELDSYGAPVNTDVSQGRFLAMSDKFLDNEIYHSGRKVVVAGIVQGMRTMKVGEIDYNYPYIEIKEIHLLKIEPNHSYGPRYHEYWGPSWWDPYYQWYNPYWFYQYYYYPEGQARKEKSKKE